MEKSSRKRKVIIIILAVMVLGILSLLIFQNGIVLVDGNRIPGIKVSARFYGKGMYTTLPVAATLEHLGFEIAQLDDHTILLNDYPYSLIMDLEKKTLTVNGSDDNLFAFEPDYDYFYCERKGNDLIVDEATLHLLLACYGGDYELVGTIPLIKLIIFQEPAVHWAPPPYVEDSFIPTP